MKITATVILASALLGSSAAASDKAPCPTRETGSSYPWQIAGMMRGDQYAWVLIDVDRTGRPVRCGIGDNNIPDPETRFRVCKAFTDDWTAPAADAGDPNTRTIKRKMIMASYDHQMANQKARKLWFKQHPEERSECYPE
jgi:hypothetical protein